VRESDSLTLAAPGVESMHALGAVIARGVAAARTHLTIALDGELGAGKTTLVSAVLNALGFGGHARSPTYTLIEPYELAGRRIYHLDLYRLVDPQEVEPLGLRDLSDSDSVFLIEWPEKGAGMLPPIDLNISIRYAGENGRSLTLEALSASGRALLSVIALTKS
jgi:tRNA threonylcarbamoyladenosine biosynthesis protein TsaE